MDAGQHALARYKSVLDALEVLREVPARDEESARRGRERFLQEVQALRQSTGSSPWSAPAP